MTKEVQYNYSDNVVNGKLCKECGCDKTCKDKKCPVHRFRKENK